MAVVVKGGAAFDISKAATGQASIIDGKTAEQVTEADLKEMLAKATSQNGIRSPHKDRRGPTCA